MGQPHFGILLPFRAPNNGDADREEMAARLVLLGEWKTR